MRSKADVGFVCRDVAGAVQEVEEELAELQAALSQQQQQLEAARLEEREARKVLYNSCWQ